MLGKGRYMEEGGGLKKEVFNDGWGRVEGSEGKGGRLREEG